MGCKLISLPHGGSAIICGRGRRTYCEHTGCGAPSTKLCDGPGTIGGTCDKRMCDEHAHNIGPDRDLCSVHFAEMEIEA